MSFNPGFNLSLQSGFQLPKGFGAGAGAAASAASGFSPWGMLLGLGGNFLNYFLGQASASTAYDRQKKLMNLSQDYNSEEAMKQRQMSSMSYLRSELQRLGLNPDLMYQNGATQGSMSNAASAGAPSVMPANVPTFDGLLNGFNSAIQQMNAETNQQNMEISAMKARAEVAQVNKNIELLNTRISNEGQEAVGKLIENAFTLEVYQSMVNKVKAESDLTVTNSRIAVITMYGAIMSYVYNYGKETALDSDGVVEIFGGKDKFKSFLDSHGITDEEAVSRLSAAIVAVTQQLKNGEINLQSLQGALLNAQKENVEKDTERKGQEININKPDEDFAGAVGVGGPVMRMAIPVLLWAIKLGLKVK